LKLNLTHTDPASAARTGWFETPHGRVETPIFMPVGTRATVKSLRSSDIRALDAQIILGNNYHLYLRPGTDILKAMGGLHRFMAWDRPILTDSGGFQVFSLKDLRKIDENGVEFQSHIDGTRHQFTPENVVDMQRAIGSDIAMVLDECPPAMSSRDFLADSMRRSMRWARRAWDHHLVTPNIYEGHRQELFGIVQGGTHADLRRESAESLMETGFDGYAIGGLAVGEPTDTMYDVVENVTPVLPVDQPRYLMGVGTPQNLLECIARGIDMFDCVMPSRNARNGTIFTSRGRVNIRNQVFRDDPSPIDPECECETCRNYSRAYVRHLFNVDEITAYVLATIHNLSFYLALMERARAAIRAGSYTPWMREQLVRLDRRELDRESS
jgi:queuine tRNA-ribosyltransferase